LLHLDPAAEGFDPEAAMRPSGAAGGQDVVRAGRVVARGDGRPRADEDRAGIPDAAGNLLGAPALEGEVLRGQRIGNGDPLVEVLDDDHASMAPQCRERLLAGCQGCGSGRQRALDGVDQLGRVGHQHGLRVRPVLRLRQEVERDEFRIGRCVGDDEALARPRREVDRHVGSDRPLGCRHPGVARADDPADARNAACAVGERGDRLGTADPEHAIDADPARGGEDRRRNAAVPARRGGDDDLVDAGERGGHADHDDRARQRGPAAGNVGTDPLERDPPAPGDDSRHGLDPALGPQRIPLVGVEAAHRRDRSVDGLEQRRFDRGDGILDLGRVDPWIAQVDAVEAARQLEQRRVPITPDRIDDRSDVDRGHVRTERSDPGGPLRLG
jgi:hypothetical protein